MQGREKGERKGEKAACARVQRFSVGREGGTSITRYIGQRGRGWNRRGRGAGKSSRAANCPPSYPPYTLSHTLTVTTLIPLPRRSLLLQPLLLILSLSLSFSSPSSLRGLFSVPLGRTDTHHPRASPLGETSPPCSLSRDAPRRAAASKALDYLPLISARVAHLLPRLSRLLRDRDRRHLQLPSFSFLFHPLRGGSRFFLPSSVLFPWLFSPSLSARGLFVYFHAHLTSRRPVPVTLNALPLRGY